MPFCRQDAQCRFCFDAGQSEEECMSHRTRTRRVKVGYQTHEVVTTCPLLRAWCCPNPNCHFYGVPGGDHGHAPNYCPSEWPDHLKGKFLRGRNQANMIAEHWIAQKCPEDTVPETIEEFQLEANRALEEFSKFLDAEGEERMLERDDTLQKIKMMTADVGAEESQSEWPETYGFYTEMWHLPDLTVHKFDVDPVSYDPEVETRDNYYNNDLPETTFPSFFGKRTTMCSRIVHGDWFTYREVYPLCQTDYYQWLCDCFMEQQRHQ